MIKIVMLTLYKKTALVGTSLLVAFSFIGIASAQQSNSTEDDKQARLQRIEARKAAQQEFLTEFKEQRLRERCEQAQVKVSATAQKAIKHQEKRLQVYDTLLGKLTLLVERLQESNKDPADLQAGIEEYSQFVASYQEQSQQYITALTDTSEMECTADVSGFNASLQAAREQVGAVKEAAKSIKTYAAQDLRKVISQYKTNQ